MAATGMGVALIGISIALSMASQMGDIAESAVKRNAGVKDSSALLPGHGGVWDRFDGMLGASLLLLVIESFTGFPSVTNLRRRACAGSAFSGPRGPSGRTRST
jgi:phosphatidate cytidylyltransferase